MVPALLERVAQQVRAVLRLGERTAGEVDMNRIAAHLGVRAAVLHMKPGVPIWGMRLTPRERSKRDDQ
jgi:hypothetical protein